MTMSARRPSLDVARAIALAGVVVMNYHAYLNPKSAYFQLSPSVWDRIFNPISGILTSRFAAGFVLVAGVGVSLMTHQARAKNDAYSLLVMRQVLLRRGLLLYAVGFGLQWIWPGTILFFYGAYFMLAAFLFARRTRDIVVCGVLSLVIAAALSAWRVSEMFSGNNTAWLSPSPNSPRNLLIRTFLDYTHPVFPWFAFFCAGLVLGRSWEQLTKIRRPILVISLGVVIAAHSIRALLSPSNVATMSDYVVSALVSTQPFDRGALYTAGTLGTALFALVCIAWVADAFPAHVVTQWCARAGQMSLSIYLAHVLFFNVVVKWLHWVRPTGLDTSLMLSASFYIVAMSIASWWVSRFGRGPAERVYRFIGG